MKETKTVQVYPSDDIVNATIEEYGSFGWEVINNQRCQEYDGQTRGVDGSVTNHYSTFNKITFTREKGAPWYEEVAQLEKEYNTTGDTIKTYRNRKPVLSQSGGSVFVGAFLYMLWIIPGIIYTVVCCCKKSKYKKQYEKESAEYYAVYPAKISELEAKQAELRARAEKCVMGKA